MLQITYNNSRVSDLRLCRESPTLRIRAVRGPYGDAIRRLRDDRDWTQEQLADRAGVQRDTIVRAEKSGNVGVLLLYQIAQAFCRRQPRGSQPQGSPCRRPEFRLVMHASPLSIERSWMTSSARSGRRLQTEQPPREAQNLRLLFGRQLDVQG
jgi:transcriptional regulator with XRE-family HTH domain